MANKNYRNTTGSAGGNSRFSSTISLNMKRSTFRQTSSHKTTFEAGRLVPIYLSEILPGDTVKMNMSHVTRLVTPIVPTMDNINLEYFAFFVPNRLVWTGWERLMGANTNGAWTPTTEAPPVPSLLVSDYGLKRGSIGNYYGLPIAQKSYSGLNAGSFSILPFRGYGLIWNEWFRDQNFQAPLPINLGDTNIGTTAVAPSARCLKVNKYRDYFTSCLPGPQKSSSLLLPVSIQDLIPVTTGATHDLSVNSLEWQGVGSDADEPIVGGTLSVQPNRTLAQTPYYMANEPTFADVAPSNLYADARGIQLDTSTIAQLRNAFQVQRVFERDARGGTRYTELLLSHFGVQAEDYRLQRPELLGFQKRTLGISQVTQTSSTDETSPQGNLAAFGYRSDGGLYLVNKSFTEHGYLHVFVVARHEKSYQDGIPKHWRRKNRLDFYTPELAHISEQPVMTSEIYAFTDEDNIFGYQEAWSEYKYRPNQVSGMFAASEAVGGGYGNNISLNQWQYADSYNDVPLLSAGWIEDNSATNINRTLAVSNTLLTDAQFYTDIYFDCKFTRPMPLRSIPGLVDHF